MKKWFISIVHILGFFLFTSTVQANDVYKITKLPNYQITKLPTVNIAIFLIILQITRWSLLLF